MTLVQMDKFQVQGCCYTAKRTIWNRCYNAMWVLILTYTVIILRNLPLFLSCKSTVLARMSYIWKIRCEFRISILQIL